jgi:hypothetical protein
VTEAPRSFWSELKRRRVVRVAVAYAIAAVAVGGAADVFLPGLGAPKWTLQTVLALLVLGLPLATALSWAYDITPEGVVRSPVSPGSDASASTVAGPRSTDADDRFRQVFSRIGLA